MRNHLENFAGPITARRFADTFNLNINHVRQWLNAENGHSVRYQYRNNRQENVYFKR